ncbi:MAG: hypothetical protein LBK61_02375 [Spirochaetaceae bacterium]|jgi:hypothetical protein|nr:hypothetical protein [Spirochaetaceae bacterium]
MTFRAAALLFFLAVASSVAAQTNTTAPSAEETIEWPQFAQDLRRFDVVSFGLYPFAYLVTGIGYDLVRSAQHGWNSAYYPWPLNDGGVGWDSDDYRKVIAGAAVVSLAVAAIDMTIVWIKRRATNKREEARSRPETEIRNTPLFSPLPEE